jgi:hypothetical protein
MPANVFWKGRDRCEKDDHWSSNAYCGCVTNNWNNYKWGYLFAASKRVVYSVLLKLWFLIMAAGVGYNLFHGLDDLSKHLA